MRQTIPPILATTMRLGFHFSPLIPLAYQRYAFTAALALLVALCYIKTWKINTMIHEQRSGGNQDLSDLERARNFWKAMTFLPD